MTKKDKREPANRVNTGGGSFIDGDVHVHGGDFVGRDQGRGGTPPPIDLDSAEAEAARARYRQALRERYNVIETHAYVALAQDEQIGNPQRLDLLGEKGVYVPLYFDAPPSRRQVEMEGRTEWPKAKDAEEMATLAEREMQPLDLAGVLQLPDHLAIVGDAGSGKTTVLHVLISTLAVESPDTVAPDLGPGLPDAPRPIPVFLPLRLFEHACTGGYAPDA
jgi:predicted NACHT family NTPase